MALRRPGRRWGRLPGATAAAALRIIQVNLAYPQVPTSPHVMGGGAEDP